MQQISLIIITLNLDDVGIDESGPGVVGCDDDLLTIVCHHYNLQYKYGINI